MGMLASLMYIRDELHINIETFRISDWRAMRK